MRQTFFSFFFFCGFNSVRRSLADAWASNIFSVCLFPKGGGARDNGRGSQHLAHFVVRVFFCRCGPSLPSAAGGARPQPPNEALISRRFGGQAVIFGMGGAIPCLLLCAALIAQPRAHGVARSSGKKFGAARRQSTIAGKRTK